MAAKLSYWMFRLRSTWRWYRSASTVYDVHSPFLSDFIQEVVLDKRNFHVFELVKQIRKFWAQHSGKVTVLKQGAESKITNSKVRAISELVAASAIGDSEGALLFRLALWSKAESILELGTNAGISSLYLHFADRRAKLHTIEGNPEVAGLARKTFEIARCSNNLHQYVGTFSEILPQLLPTLDQLDLVFIDGDHRYEATVDYVQQCLSKVNENSIVVVADIHWSADMERAWEDLKKLPTVKASIDTYHFGFLFFKSGLTPQQHLSLVDAKWKLWRMGFFS